MIKMNERSKTQSMEISETKFQCRNQIDEWINA